MSTRKILIVDDNPNMSTLLSDILEIFDFKGIHAESGNEALDKLKGHKYDMVFTDLRMPNMHGTDLLKAIKADHPKIPVVVVTGYSVEKDHNEILSKQADGFLHKPFRVKEIEIILSDLLGHMS
jgi:CheY-like chemotaxis protein